MSPLVADETVQWIDRIMERSGFTRDRMHVTGKRWENLPDLLVYSGSRPNQSLTVGLEDKEGDEGARTRIQVKFVNKETREWESMDDFDSEIDEWLAARSAAE